MHRGEQLHCRTIAACVHGRRTWQQGNPMTPLSPPTVSMSATQKQQIHIHKKHTHITILMSLIHSLTSVTQPNKKKRSPQVPKSHAGTKAHFSQPLSLPRPGRGSQHSAPTRGISWRCVCGVDMRYVWRGYEVCVWRGYEVNVWRGYEVCV